MSKAIQFENIGKQYRLGLVSSGTISHDLNRWWTMNVLHKEDPYLRIGETNDRAHRGKSDYVWALKDINFSVEEGDVVGIIGKNGAGKSTLLKLLSRVTAPTTGVIRARGRIASLLEVGTGFHPEMTGRENIYMNGAIMGMTKAEITRKLDEIVDFSGCERYIDTPVKRYSSGMTVRLGFAIAAHLEPEILVVDEVLAVGDAEFQKKAIGKMQDVSKGGGRTVLFVSHNMASIRQLCKSGVLIDNGQIKGKGDIETIVGLYLNQHVDNKAKRIYAASQHRLFSGQKPEEMFYYFEFKKDNPIFSTDEDIELIISIKSQTDKKDCRINCTIYDQTDIPIGSCTSFDTFDLVKGTNLISYIIYSPKLVIGHYSISFSIGHGNACEGEINYDIVSHIIGFEIDRLSQKQKQFYVQWNRDWGNCFFKTKTKILYDK